MPAFTFEKISPPVRRGPIAPIVKKQRGVIVQILDRFVEARVKRKLPGGALVLAVLAINFIGDGLRDAFDPRSPSPKSRSAHVLPSRSTPPTTRCASPSCPSRASGPSKR